MKKLREILEIFPLTEEEIENILKQVDPTERSAKMLDDIKAITGLVDEEYQGFSNRETYEASQYFGRNSADDESIVDSMVQEYGENAADELNSAYLCVRSRFEFLGDDIESQLSMLECVGSYWRVNWEEVIEKNYAGEWKKVGETK